MPRLDARRSPRDGTSPYSSGAPQKVQLLSSICCCGPNPLIREGGSPYDRREAGGSQDHGRGTHLRQRRRRRRRARDLYSALVQRTERQLAAGAIALLGLFAVKFRPERDAPDARSGINSNGRRRRAARVFGYDVVAYHLNEVRPSQAGVPGSSEYSASLSTSYGSYVFWFQNNHNRDLFIKNPWAYAPRMGGHCTASVAYVEGAAKVVTGASSVPICVGEKDRTKRRPWVSPGSLSPINSTSSTATRRGSSVDRKTTSIRAPVNNWSRSRRWPRPTGLRNSARQRTGPSTRRTLYWLMGEVQGRLQAHGAGFGCTGVQEPRDRRLPGTLMGERELRGPMQSMVCAELQQTCWRPGDY